LLARLLTSKSAKSDARVVANCFRLAGDLYDVPTRFVLESIQNADDNDYEAGIKPFLRLSVAPKQIRLDCNEKGFKEDHVRAICSVGQSTKSKQKATEGKIGFIGEKGIGFKSVFKLAERVYIHSPPFSFMFDKRRELGMITPSWVPEGEVRSLLRAADSQTAIFLLPNAGETYDEPELLNEFLSIHSTLLLFLRKLKMLELVFTDLSLGSGLSSFHKTLACEMLDSRRVAILTERDVITSKILKREKYYLFEQVREITLAVEEERRKGVKRTELALAFLLESDRYIGVISIYWRLTICRMTRYRSVKNKKRGRNLKYSSYIPTSGWRFPLVYYKSA